MGISLSVPENNPPIATPRITVMGVGGAGGNAVNNMISSNLQGVEFVVANTDAQALAASLTNRRIQLGSTTTKGLGAGAKPEVGRAAAEESIEEIAEQIDGSNMCFITAGMGGGTGTGAAPVVARAAKELGILTVGVVTKPFNFEGRNRMTLARAGIDDLAKCVDTLIIIPNQNLFKIADEKTTFADAFKLADEVLHDGVRSVTDLMIRPGMINLDFADVNTVMAEMGRAMMGTGEASGERRALDAAEAAIANPLLENICMRGAQGVLINITGGNDVTLYEIDEAATRIGDEIEGDANIIFGSCLDDEMEGKIRVSVVATGIPSEDNAANTPEPGRLTRQTSATSTGISSARSAPAASSSQDMLSQHHTQSAAPKTDPQTQSTEDAAPQTLAERMAFSQKADETAHKEAEDLPEMNKPVFTAHSQVAKPQTQVAKPQVADSAKPRFYQEQPAPDRDREFSTSTKSSAATQSPERFIPEAPLATRPSGNRMALNIPNTAPAPEETPAQSYGATESNLAVDTHALAENGAAHTPTYQETQPQPHATEDHNGEGIGSGLRRSLFGITRRSATSQNTPSATPDQAASLSANPADRLVPTQPDSNELDIPTFLRRKQAN